MLLPPSMREMSQKAFSPSVKVILSKGMLRMGTLLANRPMMMANNR